MHRIIGKNVVLYSEQQLAELISEHDRVAIEVGCGNGAFLRALVEREPTTLAIGFDPSVDALKRLSRLAANLGDNPVFLRAAIEIPPPELTGLADALYIHFPWGSLLRGLVQPDDMVLANISGLMKDAAEFHLLVTYDPVRDASLNLPELTDEHFRERLAPLYSRHGLLMQSWGPATPDEILASRSSWSKRLRSNKQRLVWSVRGTKQGN
jgi:16S rRNA (adenine(1408)-N(1))-methyltransferase